MTPQQVVVTDTNILVNLAHAGRLALLNELLPYQFVLPVEVLDEIKDTQQLAAVNGLLVQGVLTLLTTMSISQLSTYANLKSRMGSGEAACIAWAECDVLYLIASDEKRIFRREVVARLGENRLLRTQDILLHAIRIGRLTVQDADSIKSLLESKRFRMPFTSFNELL